MEFFGMSGEKLGTIGGETVTKTVESLPAWKEAFLSSPSVSVRRGIASNYDRPYEDTATLVLTARSGKFVDIRFPISSSIVTGQPVTIHPKFWAFSGVVQTTFLEPAANGADLNGVTMPYSAHAVFVHDIDSKGPGIIDEGDMFLLPNGDTMEVGLWTNPVTGKYEMYKEYWTEPAPQFGAPRHEDNGTSGTQVDKVPCIVAESVNPKHGRGIIIRIGNFIQGIYRDADQGAGCVVMRAEQYYCQEFPTATDSNDRRASIWTYDPRNTGDERHFPMSLLEYHHLETMLGDTLQTELTGLWQITEVVI